ncbi:MAG: hemolysin family protein [Microthrixaceae bacterium]|nr:HlyC/CorC family transporter [Microthrixaceae bacterium]MCO5319658.1 hemolysin family protein [Microthrixaceae bacterium]
MNQALLVLAGVALVVANGFFVAMEFALLAARRGRIEDAVEDGRFGASSALAGMRSLNVQLAACQLGITAMSLMLGWIIEPVLGGAVEGVLHRTALPEGAAAVIGLVIALSLLSFVHMVAGEMVPKSVALAKPEPTLLLLAPLHRAVTTALRPVVWLLNNLGTLGARALRVEPAEELTQAHTPEELAVMLDEAAALGNLDAGEADLLSGALGFLAVRVRDVMAPAADLVTIPATATVAQAEELLVRSGHSRVLVTEADSVAAGGEVVGFLHVKDLLAHDELGSGDLLPPGLVRVALRVGADESLPDVLLKMRRARRHVAVVSEGARSSDPVEGLVTMEDLLEALVGEITDESDRTGPAGRQQQRSTR